MSPLPRRVLPRPGCLYCAGLASSCTCVADCGVRAGQPSQGQDSEQWGSAAHTCPIYLRKRNQNRSEEQGERT